MNNLKYKLTPQFMICHVFINFSSNLTFVNLNSHNQLKTSTKIVNGKLQIHGDKYILGMYYKKETEVVRKRSQNIR